MVELYLKGAPNWLNNEVNTKTITAIRTHPKLAQYHTNTIIKQFLVER